MATRRRRRPSGFSLPQRPRAQASSVTAPAVPAPLLPLRRQLTADRPTQRQPRLTQRPRSFRRRRASRAPSSSTSKQLGKPPRMDQTPRLGFQVPWTAPAVPAPLLPSRRQLTAGRPTRRQPQLTQRPHSFRRRRASRAPSPSTSKPAARSRAIIQVARLPRRLRRLPSTQREPLHPPAGSLRSEQTRAGSARC